MIGVTPFSLFLGAGSSLTAGGPNGASLLSSIKSHFKLTSEEKSFFNLMDQIVGDSAMKRSQAESGIKDFLIHIGPKPDHRYLFSLPWRAVLTTNYDKLPEAIGNTLDGTRTVKVLVTPNQDTNMQKPDILYCFKLFGDIEISYPERGALVLTNADRRQAYFQRDLFEHFFELAASGNVLYIGYSFDDELVFDVLSDMTRAVNRRMWPGFLITPHEPPARIRDKMRDLHIEWIEGTLEEFISQCRGTFGSVPKSSYVESSPIIIHGRSVTLDRDIESNIHTKYHVLRQSDFKKIQGMSFITGDDRNFEPYKLGWDYPRKFTAIPLRGQYHIVPKNSAEFVRQRIGLDATDNKIFWISGSAASGKTIAANRIAYDWYIGGNPVIFLEHPIKIDRKALVDLLNELRKRYHSYFKSETTEIKSLRYLLIIENCRPHLTDIKDLHNFLRSSGLPVDIIIVERNTAIEAEKVESTGIDIILKLDDSINESESEQFLRHFSRLGLLTDKAIVRANIKNQEINTSFFALLYTSIHLIQASLRNRIHNEFESLDYDLKRIFSIASIFKSYEQPAYLSLFSKVCGIDPFTIVSYIKSNKIPFLSFDDEISEVVVNLRVIADIISERAFPSSTETKIILTKIIEAVNFAETNQLSLLHDLVVGRIGEQHRHVIFSFAEQEELFKSAISLVKTGLLLHHLSILYLHNESFDKCSECINEAYNVTEKRNPERVQFVKDTEGRLEISLAKQVSSDDKDEAIRHLQRAEGLFQEAIISEVQTPHPYAGLAETYLELSRLSNSTDDKQNMLVSAISACSTYFNSSLDLNIKKFNFLQEQIFFEFNKIGFDKNVAKRLAVTYNNANGFAYLADKKIKNMDHRGALDLINEGLTFDPGSSWLNILRIGCIRKLWPDDLNTLGKSLENWEKSAKKPYPINLNFELAKYRYMNGQERKALESFSELSEQMYGRPSRIVVERNDIWKEGDVAKRFKGNMLLVPRPDFTGKIQCTSETSITEPIRVNYKAIKYDKPRRHDDVYFQVAFSYTGPVASFVRLDTRN